MPLTQVSPMSQKIKYNKLATWPALPWCLCWLLFFMIVVALVVVSEKAVGNLFDCFVQVFLSKLSLTCLFTSCSIPTFKPFSLQRILLLNSLLIYLVLILVLNYYIFWYMSLATYSFLQPVMVNWLWVTYFLDDYATTFRFFWQSKDIPHGCIRLANFRAKPASVV